MREQLGGYLVSTTDAKQVVVQLSKTTRLHSHWEPNQTRHIPAQVGKRLQQLPAPTDYPGGTWGPLQHEHGQLGSLAMWCLAELQGRAALPKPCRQHPLRIRCLPGLTGVVQEGRAWHSVAAEHHAHVALAGSVVVALSCSPLTC